MAATIASYELQTESQFLAKFSSYNQKLSWKK